jgi:hypothetical protein
MAILELSCNLSSSLFPFATEMWGRSIIFPQGDMNYNRTIFSSKDPGFEKQTPQVMYMHNVMPSVEGYQSVGYTTVISPNVDAGASGAFGSFSFGSSGFGSAGSSSFVYDRAFPIQTAAKNNFIFVPSAGRNFIYDAVVGMWNSVSPFSTGEVNDDVQVTTAFVNGETYICYYKKGVYIYNETTKTLDVQTLLGIDVSQVVAVTAANGYLICATESALAWSNLTNPLDFVPSITTGAGGGNVQEAKGKITSVAHINGGFIIYCEKNAVGATYSGNSQFPFIFLEVAGSGGLTSMENLSWDANLATQIMWSSKGIQEVSKTTAKPSYPELGDFLSSRLFEDFDESFLTFTSEYLSSTVNVRLVIVQSRFLVVSYGITPPIFTHALVFDLDLQRWGKLKIDHTDCFEWNNPNLYGSVTYDMLVDTTYDALAETTYDELSTQMSSITEDRRSVAFLQSDGTVKLLNFDADQSTNTGVFLIGKFQFRRRQIIQHQYGIVDTVNSNNNFNYYIFPTFDGKTFRTPIQANRNTRRGTSGKTRTYQRTASGINISILFLGVFNLSSFLIGFTMGGNR